MKQNIGSTISDVLNGTLLSYAQVFFSKSKIFSWFILIISFTYPELGFSGVLCALSSLIFAIIFGLNRTFIRNGYFAYNALLVGLGIGYYYSLNLPLVVILILAGLITLLVHILIESWLSKYRLPVLSLPFIITLWFILLATRQLEFFQLSDRNIYILNNIFYWGGKNFLTFYHWFNEEFLPPSLQYFFVALGSIFFQDTALAGFIIFIGLFIFSRISSLLAIVGFYMAYLFMQFVGIQETQISIYYVGFNFILTSIAIGGVFLIPNIYSHIWILILTPVNVILTLAFSSLLSTWQLSVLSLTFNLVVFSFLLTIRSRYVGNRKLIETVYQEFMPEKNLYSYVSSKQKDTHHRYSPVLLLPFWGEWTVWQGYNGKHTHKELYQHALDFVITFQGKTYKNNGASLEDYYTYNKLVVSPGNGWIVRIVDNVEDNIIGQVNTQNNWGNSIIIKHSEYIYSQLSHLKAGSFKVREGDYVKLGQPLAHVGNSGRSPEPHLHFQIQAYPIIGSPTIEYPISRYVSINGKHKKLVCNSVPIENEQVENIILHSNLMQAFQFTPGQSIEIIQIINEKQQVFQWEIATDSFNNTYIYNKTTSSLAYIYKNDLMFYFTSYHGSKKDPLYLFYCSCFHIEFALLPGQVFKQEFPLHLIYEFYQTFWQDNFAPFHRIMRAWYEMTLTSDNQGSAVINANMFKKYFLKSKQSAKMKIHIQNQHITKIEWHDYNNEIILYFTYKNKL
ncbi:MAG: urea transporter [Bacteroidales bacterium]|nr:urea transporter [Bacteroidales bacterium]